MKAHHTVLNPTIALFETQLHTKPLDELEPGLDHVAPQRCVAIERAVNLEACPHGTRGRVVRDIKIEVGACDCILIKGSRGRMTMPVLALGGTKSFSLPIAKECLQKWRNP